MREKGGREGGSSFTTSRSFLQVHSTTINRYTGVKRNNSGANNRPYKRKTKDKPKGRRRVARACLRGPNNGASRPFPLMRSTSSPSSLRTVANTFPRSLKGQRYIRTSARSSLRLATFAGRQRGRSGKGVGGGQRGVVCVCVWVGGGGGEVNKVRKTRAFDMMTTFLQKKDEDTSSRLASLRQ